jgi:hypothetical protein
MYNHTSSKVFIDSLADLSFTSLTSNQPVEGSIIVNANNSLFPLGFLMVNGPMRSTSTLFQAMGLYSSFSGRSPYFVDITPSSQPDRALSSLNYGLTPNCNLSQSRHGRTPIVCTHTTGNSNTHLSQVSYRDLLRSQYKQGCNQCEHSYKQVYQNINAHQLHLDAPYKHICVSVSTSPVERTN